MVLQVIMLDSERYLATLVYDDQQDPDAVLRDFANDTNAQGFRVVGMVQAGQCADSSLSAVLVHNGETLLLAQDFDPNASGCRLDIGRLQNAGARVADALSSGADLLIVNRFGKRERDGKGLGYLIERARDAGTPAVIAVSSHRLADWSTFAGETTHLACERAALDAWWREISAQPSMSAGPQRLRPDTDAGHS